MTNHTDQPLALLGGLSPSRFLQEYWQKKTLLVRQAIPGYQCPISPDELAGLSLEPELESRIIIEQGATPWELRHGPFNEETFRQLPETHWTLLVQAVDQFVPEMAALLEEFRFLPSWRFDDIMISYAAPGGSVGPHYDHYDVFLLQGKGHRRWKIGNSENSHSPIQPHPHLRLLAEFAQEDEWVLEPGDLLYLPPQIAHYGIAEDDCMTISIGLRAPSAAQVLTHFTDYLTQFLSEEQRYTDPDLALAESPSHIGSDALHRLQTLLQQHLADEQRLLDWFGQFVTDPRYPELLEGDDITPQQLRQELQEGATILRHPSARMAWSDHDDRLVLYASGSSRALPPALKELVQQLCDAHCLYQDNLISWMENPEGMELLCELLEQGSLEFSHD